MANDLPRLARLTAKQAALWGVSPHRGALQANKGLSRRDDSNAP
jgi:hypothetical protein